MSVDSLELRRKEAREQLLGRLGKFGVDSLGLLRGMYLTRLIRGPVVTDSALIAEQLVRQGVVNIRRPNVKKEASTLAGDLAEVYTLEKERWDRLYTLPSVTRLIGTFDIQIP